MADFDYGNARLRAMKSRLLSRREIDALVEVGNVSGVIAALIQTDYQKSIQTALTRANGLACITEALHNNLIEVVGKIRNFYKDSAAEEVGLLLRAYDIRNLKVVLRGLAGNTAPGEILALILPVGELESGVLGELARASGVRACVDMLASMGLAFREPLLRLRGERPGAETSEMELELEKWHFEDAFQTIANLPGNTSILHAAYQLEADLTNLFTVLRFARAPSERRFLRDWLESDNLQRLFVGPGRLPFHLLVQAGSQETINAAVGILSGTPYEAVLHAGLESYSQSARLSDFEKTLNRFRLKWMAAQVTNDPLGVGVVLGYLALKTNEVSNIRWIAKAFDLGLSVESIRSEVIVIS
jgi:V/A-type H+-transporting ATPase subunit C